MFRLTLISIFLFASQMFAQSYHQGPPHLDLETTSAEYQALLREQPAVTDLQESPEATDSEDISLNQWLTLGQRNLQWVDLVNQHRTPETKVSLSSPATQGGYPVSTPSTYNFNIINEKWQILQALLPAPLKKVIFEGAPLTADVPVTDREFIEWLAQVDRAYQISARYKLMKPWKEELTRRAKYDVRGYLQIKTDAQVDQKLNQWASLSAGQRAQLSTSLSQICWKLNSPNDCDRELTTAINNRTLVAFKNKYMPASQDHYESYFKIQARRPDVVWSSANPNLFQIPFTNPHNETVLNYLKFNIQDEWKWNDWHLQLNFVESNSSETTHVVFVPGSTPHVDGIAGSEITMDANAPLSEYDVQWTIRHEYGHVLGYVDCYLEFYDTSAEAYVSYQLDVTNLMCSRRGHLKQVHFDELKRTYFK